MLISFLGFGVFFIILRAASTQSAPRQFLPGTEEDDYINRLAHVDPDDLEVDLQLPEYYTGGGRNGIDDYFPDKGIDNLTPKQVKNQGPFGYTPHRPEFYLPREALVASTNRERNEIFPNGQQLLHPEIHKFGPPPPPYMKKSNDGRSYDAQDSGGEPVPVDIQAFTQPGHITRSTHAVDHSGTPYATRLNEPTSMFYIVIVAAGSAMGVILVVGAGICWYRINERIKATADVDYPAYGVTGPSKDVSPTGGDRKLAQSAHMYHYQHQKQQMAALQKSPLAADGQGSAGSDLESDDENEEGDYTVYECPGLAPAGDMEVKNPLYQDEPTPATPNTVKCESEGGNAGESGGGVK